MPGYAIGIDLGATKLASALVDKKGNVIAHYKTNTLTSSADVVIEIGHHVRKLAQGAAGQIQGVGVGAPGWHDQDKGIVEGSVNLGEQTMYLRKGLENEFDYPIFHATDAHAEALGEWLFGAGQGSHTMIYFGIGSGLGSGFIIEDRLFRGANGIAANVAHFSYGFEGSVCGCGLSGCLEEHIGGLAIPHLVENLLLSGDYPDCTFTKKSSNQELLQNALQGNSFAIAVFEEMGKWLGVALSVPLAMINPDRVVIGGGLGKAAFELIYPAMIVEAKRRTIQKTWQMLTVKKSEISNSAIGAACLVWHEKLV